MNLLNEQPLCEGLGYYAIIEVPPIDPAFPWLIKIQTRGGAITKEYYLGAGGPITQLTFRITRKGCQDCSITFSEEDLPFLYGDVIYIYYKGEIFYRGFVEEVPEAEGGPLKAVSYIKRLSETLHNEAFVNQTIKQIIQAVVSDNSLVTNVYYNASLMSILDSATYSPTYVHEQLDKIIDDFVKMSDDTEWGVNANGFLFALQDKSVVSSNLLYGENNGYSGIEVRRDISKVEVTEYKVYKKSGSGTTVFVGTVPDGATYPLLDLEDIIGKKITKKITAPDNLSSADCLKWAYAKIKAQVTSDSIEFMADITKYNLKPGDLISVFGVPGIQKDEIIDCNSLSGWGGSDTISLATDSVQGGISLQAEISSNIMLFYDLGEAKRFLQPKKITFYLKSNSFRELVVSLSQNRLIGYSNADYSELDYSENPNFTGSTYPFHTTNSWTIVPKGSGLWQCIELENIPELFRYIYFKGTVPTSTIIKLDSICVYHWFPKRYETTVQEVEYNLAPDNLSIYKVKCGSFNRKSNDLLFEIEKRIKQLESVTA